MKIFIYIIIGAGLIIAYVRFLEKKMVFVPSRVLAHRPLDIGLAYDDVSLTTEDGVKLNGWFIKSSDTNINSTLVYFHGNAGNIGDRLDKIGIFARLGLNVFIIDYRGYGKSQGRPSEEGAYKDALAAYDYLLRRDDIDPKKIIGYGGSLGGAIAIDLATKRPVAALIVDSSFSSAADMSKRIFPFLPTAILSTKMDSLSKVKNITAPKLFIHSREDTVVPFVFGEKLYQAAAAPKEFLEIKGGHNDSHLFDQDNFEGGIRSFLKSLNLI